MSNHLRTVYAAGSLPLKLSVVILALSLLHIFVMVIHYEIVAVPWLLRDLFDLDQEQSFGTWFSVVILLFTGYVLLLYARELRKRNGPKPLAWQILGFGFCFLSLDEMVGLHETLNSFIEMSWAIPGGIVAILVGVIYIPFLRHLPTGTLWLFLLGGLLYVGGAIGVELATEPYADEDLLDTLEYNLTTVIEEAMEMCGVVVFIYAVLDHIAGETGKGVSVDIEVKQ